MGQAYALWCFVTFATVATGTLLMGTRPDLASQVASPRFLFAFGSVALCFAVAGIGSLLLSIPGRMRLERFAPVLVLSLSVWLGGSLGLVALDVSNAADVTLDQGLECTLATLGLALVPAALLAYQVKARAPTRPAWNALTMAVAAFSAGALGVLLHCPVDQMLHHLVWHASPLLGVGALSFIVGRRLLRW